MRSMSDVLVIDGDPLICLAPSPLAGEGRGEGLQYEHTARSKAAPSP